MRNFQKYTGILVLFLIANALQAQVGNIIFNDSVLHRIDITIKPWNWFSILEKDYNNNQINPDSFPEIYRECDVTFDGVTIAKSGIREKGNSSNSMHIGSVKKPFKIAFDGIIDQKYDGIKKINLNNFTNDPSLIHEAIAYKLYREKGLVAPRTSYARVYFNGVYWGLYLIIENVDKTFLKYHYGGSGNNGNLYKTKPGAQVFFNYLGAHDSFYQNAGLELKTNESTPDWSRLMTFIDKLNHLSDAEMESFLDSSFAVHDYLKILAIEKCIRSWDSYWGNGNNFYVYEHPDGKIHWIPWDLNESFQDIKILEPTHLTDGYLIPSKHLDERPLLKRMLTIEKWKKEFFDNVCDLIHSNFTPEGIGRYAVMCHNLADVPYKEDPNKFNTYADFEKSLTEHHKDEVLINNSSYQITLRYPGIFPFIQSQRNWASDQLKGWGQTCVIEKKSMHQIAFYPNPAEHEVFVKQHGNEFDYSQIIIYSISGAVVQKEKYLIFDGTKTRIDLKALSKGIYTIMKIGVNGDVGYGRLVVN